MHWLVPRPIPSSLILNNERLGMVLRIKRFSEIINHSDIYVPSIECVFMLLYNVCSIMPLTDEGMRQVDHLIKMTLVHSQFLYSLVLNINQCTTHCKVTLICWTYTNLLKIIKLPHQHLTVFQISPSLLRASHGNTIPHQALDAIYLPVEVHQGEGLL